MHACNHAKWHLPPTGYCKEAKGLTDLMVAAMEHGPCGQLEYQHFDQICLYLKRQVLFLQSGGSI